MGEVAQRLDAHHHVWDLDARDQLWIDRVAMAPIARSFGVDELALAAADCSIDGTIVVQTAADTVETEELLDLAISTDLVRGVIGWTDVTAPGVGDELDRLRELPTGGRLVGIRSLAQYEPDLRWLARPDVIDGLRAVASRGLTFDLLVLPHQLPGACAAARAVPEARFVLDHLGKPGVPTRPSWETGIAELASCPNVYVKISGLVIESDWSDWDPRRLQPYVEFVLNLFGPDRLLFGSDWPVCTLAASYARIVEVTEELLSALTATERAAVFGGTAQHAYGLVGRPREGST
ncbi:MAG TPA: amidohydrolase family protein [Ilumatobacteraceae bacterium]